MKSFAWHRVWALMVRHIIKIPRDVHKFSMFLYWPLINVLLWGFAARWISGDGSATATVIVSGVVLSEIMGMATYTIAAHLLEELWSSNVSNIFATPITLREWVVSAIGMAAICLGFELLYCSLLTTMFYGTSVIHALGFYAIPTIAMLFIAGIVIGFFALSPLLIWGQRVESFTFMFGWLFAPLSGVFYPISVLPPVGQSISAAIPMRHIFDAVRSVIETGIYPWESIALAAVLCVIYGCLGAGLFSYAYRISISRGLNRLLS
jgi:ABC-2 type transport system permease protein